MKTMKIGGPNCKNKTKGQKKIFLSKKVKNYMEKHILPGSKQLRKIGDAHH